MESTELKVDQLVERYLDICMSAIHANAERFPFKQIFTALSDPECDKTIAAYVEDADSIRSLYIHVHGESFKVQSAPEDLPKKIWRVNKGFLEDVVETPLIYINNPARIDWDWLYEPA